MANFGQYGFPTPDQDAAASPTATGDVRVDQAPPSGALPPTPAALTVPRLGAPGGVAPLGGDGLVPSAYLPPPSPAGSLGEAARWTRSGSNPLLSPVASWEETAVYEPTVLYEAGTFKMWYGGGWANGAIGYATSTDGITWTKYSGNPVIGQGGSAIAGFAARNSVLKVGAQYYAYFCDATPGTLHVATSPDGTSWTPRGVALAAGAASWASGWANSTVWYDASLATWYMLVEGRAYSGSIWKMALATSPDGIVWTLDSHGPLSTLQRGTGSYGGPWIPAAPKMDGLYQLYYHAATSGDLPTDLYRATSPDLITWTQVSGAILTHTGAGIEIDQVADPSIVEANGQSYLYYAGMDNPSSAGHVGVATFAGPLADLIYGCGLPALLNGSGLLPASEGGTGVDGSAAANGQLPIGTGSGFSLRTLTAGSGVTITNGAGTITVAATASGSTSPLTTKGDVWGYSSVDARVPVGADGLALLADSTQTLGVRWGAPAPSSLLVLLPNPYNFVDDSASDNGQPPDFIMTAAGDVIGVGGL